MKLTKKYLENGMPKTLLFIEQNHTDKRLADIISVLDYLTPEQTKAILELRLQRINRFRKRKS